MRVPRRVVVGVVLGMAGGALAAQSPQTPLPGSALPQFVDPLPLLSVQGGDIQTVAGNTPLEISMCEFQANVLPTGTFAPNVTPKTWVWGYVLGRKCPDKKQTYTGPVIVSQRGSPTTVTYLNQLGDAATTNVLAYRYSTDQTLYWADPLHREANICHRIDGIPPYLSRCAQNYAGPVPAIPHLHGGEVPPEVDGNPEAWFTSRGGLTGPAYFTSAPGPRNRAVFPYPNVQEAAPLWFHDHTLGATRLNVYAGLAGAYFITDPNLQLPPNLPGPSQIVPVVIQDRMFDTNGQLFFPADTAGGTLYAPNPEHPYWVPEFIGDTIAVNGKVWPYLQVKPQRYRMLILNGSNARAYELFLTNQATGAAGPAFWVIGDDGGYLDAPVKVDPALGQKLFIMPGERYEVIVDFGAVPSGTTLLLRNTSTAPFPSGDPPDEATTGRVMQFRIALGPRPLDTSYDPASGIPLRQPGQTIQRLTSPSTGTLAPGVTVQKTRLLTLNEVEGEPSTAIDPVTGQLTMYPGGPLTVLVNNTKYTGQSPRPYGDFVPIRTDSGPVNRYSELPQEGDTELWEIANLTADAHPIHLHLVQFQILNRQEMEVDAYSAVYAAAFPAVPGSPTCTGGVFCPEFGPPLDYFTGNPLALGGNPDVGPFLEGPLLPPRPEESGWKDTIVVPPGAVTRFVVRWAPADLPVTAPRADLYFPFDPTGGGDRGYVWHCHIVDHEDNEMMRPDFVQLNLLAPPPEERAEQCERPIQWSDDEGGECHPRCDQPVLWAGNFWGKGPRKCDQPVQWMNDEGKKCHPRCDQPIPWWNDKKH